MRCPKCKQDNSTSTGSRVITGGRSQNVYKCKACGELFEVDHYRKFSRNIGQMSNACDNARKAAGDRRRKNENKNKKSIREH